MNCRRVSSDTISLHIWWLRLWKMSYEPKNILITGGAGFIASHVAEHLFFKYPKYKMLGSQNDFLKGLSRVTF